MRREARRKSVRGVHCTALGHAGVVARWRSSWLIGRAVGAGAIVALLVLILLASTSVLALAAERTVTVIDEKDSVVLRGNVHPLAQSKFEEGPSPLDLPMERIILSLAPRPGTQKRLEKLLAEQVDPGSPNYHGWLTPEQFAEQFGLSDADLAAVTDWIESNGFVVGEVARSRMWINFSGTVEKVERVFHTQIRQYKVNGVVRHANSVDPSIPRALAPVVNGVVTLHDFPRKALNHGFRALSPEEIDPLYNSGSDHYLAPGDFAKIYNVNPLYTAGNTGAGQTIAIVGRTDIQLGDVQYFRSYFGLPANDPVFVHNGTAPGNLGGGEEGEADLDVEWSGAVAKNATIKFVISKSTNSTDGVDLSAQYIVNNNLAPVMSTSFGQCESTMGTTEMTFYNNLWSQAAAQGISSFVSSGDSGASGCDGGDASTGSGRAVSGLCSSPNDICVGGTQFMDDTNPSAYWASSMDPTTKTSALSYIPEKAWNESGNVSGGSGLWATGGGASGTYGKPSWQVATGVPADSKRDVPDVSLSGAGHDGYIVVQGHTSTSSGLTATGGTSASSPSFAGLMALVVRQTGARQGNANARFYQLGKAQYGSGGAAVFHDTTTGNNSVPGVTGYSCTAGYDLATGLGSVDASALVGNWSVAPAPDFTASVSPSSVSAAKGGSATTTVTTSATGGFNSSVSLSASGLPSGASASFSPTSIVAPGSGSSTLTLSTGTAAAGAYGVTVTATGGGKTHTATVSLTITASGSSEVEPNNGTSSANVLTTNGGTLTGYINPSGDRDYFKVTVPAAHTVTVDLTVPSGKDYDVKLYSSAGSVLASGTKGAGQAEHVTWVNPNSTSRVVYIKVYGYASSDYSASSAYQMKATW